LRSKASLRLKRAINDLEGYLLRDKRDVLVQLAHETDMVAGFLDGPMSTPNTRSWRDPSRNQKA
jgi:hypothetical protein